MDPWIHGSAGAAARAAARAAAGAAAGAAASAATVCTYYVIIGEALRTSLYLHGDGPELLNKKIQFQTYHSESTPRALRQPTIAGRLRSVRSLEANPSQNGALTIPLPLRSHYATTTPDTPHRPEVCKFQQN